MKVKDGFSLLDGSSGLESEKDAKIKQKLKTNKQMLFEVARAVYHQEAKLLKAREYHEKKGRLLKDSDWFQNELMMLIGLVNALELIHPEPNSVNRFSYLEDLRK